MLVPVVVHLLEGIAPGLWVVAEEGVLVPWVFAGAGPEVLALGA